MTTYADAWPLSNPDVAAFVDHTRNALELGQDQVVQISRDAVVITDFDGNPVEAKPFTVTWDAAAAEKGGYDLFMLKEIAEQPKAVADSLRGRVARDGRLRFILARGIGQAFVADDVPGDMVRAVLDDALRA